MHDQGESIINQSDSPELDNEIPDVFDGVEGKTIDVVGDKPFEDPHRLVQHQGLVEMIVEFGIKPF